MAASCALALLVLSGCSDDGPILGKYAAFKADQGYAIVRDPMVVVDPTVQQYKVVAKRYIIGIRVAPKYARGWFSEAYGGFVLDTSTGVLRSGLRSDEVTAWLDHRLLRPSYDQASWTYLDD